jgi:hypothetical protein
MADIDTPVDIAVVAQRNSGQVIGPVGSHQIFRSEPSAGASQQAPADPAAVGAAQARLTQLQADSAWREKLLTGSGPQLREFHELMKTIVDGGQSPAVGGTFETTDSISDREAQTSLARSALIDQLELPEPSVNYLNAMDRGEPVVRPSEGDGLIAKRMLDRLSQSQTWRDNIMQKQPAAMKLFKQLNMLKAWAQQDGRPVSPEVSTLLHEHGLM